jgi:hypothetical protein
VPRYFFHATNGPQERDTEGTELENLNAARKEAVQFAGSVLRDAPNEIWDGRDFRVDVFDENNNPLLVVITMAIDASVVSTHRAKHETLATDAVDKVFQRVAAKVTRAADR